MVLCILSVVLLRICYILKQCEKTETEKKNAAMVAQNGMVFNSLAISNRSQSTRYVNKLAVVFLHNK